jgi:hypothetical protein
VWNTIRVLPPDIAPKPDGFTTRFLQVVWPVIQPDLMAAFDAFWCLNFRNLHCTNDALISLLPKSTKAASIKDYRPISLIHMVGKLISKVLANHLALKLDRVVHPSQGAFLQGRVIHDNFRMVQCPAKLLHARQTPALLLKVDIACAFNSVSWPFLLEVLEHLGFPRR